MLESRADDEDLFDGDSGTSNVEIGAPVTDVGVAVTESGSVYFSEAAGGAWSGHPFLPGSFTAASQIVEIAPGANLAGSPDAWPWVDITGPQLVMWEPGITITCGQSDEASQPTPATCSFTLRNDTGDFTRNNPLSRFFPYIKVDLPVRVRLDVGNGPSTQFQGYVSALEPSWEAGTRLALMKVTARGILQRIQSGTHALRSALYRAHTSATSTAVAYWPLEDVAGSTVAAAAIGGNNGTVYGSPASTFGFGGASVSQGVTNVASDNLALPASPSVGIFPVATFPASWSSSQGWSISWVAKVPEVPTGVSSLLLEVFTGDSTSWDWQVDITTAGNVQVIIYNSDRSAVFTGSTTALDSSLYGQWLFWQLEASPSGGNTTVTIAWSTYAGAVTSISDNLAHVSSQPTRIDFPAATATADKIGVGHLAVWPSPFPGITASIAFGYINELASARVARLCSEENIPCTVVGTSDIAMGQQNSATLNSLITEAVTADAGILTDGRGPGLLFVTQSAIANQAAQLSLDSTAGNLLGSLVPKADDLTAANAFTVSRKNGSSATYVAPEVSSDSTVARRESSLTVNTADDTLLYSRASFEVAKQRVDDYRYPDIRFSPAKSLALAQAWLDARVGHRIDVLHLPSLIPTYPPADVALLVTGYTVAWNSRYWEVRPNTSPYAPYRSFVIQGTVSDTKWRLDAGASATTAEVLPGGTSMTVASTDGTLWSTSAGDYPIDVSVGGARVTVTAVAGGSSPQTFTITANAYRLPAGAKVALWRPPKLRF